MHFSKNNPLKICIFKKITPLKYAFILFQQEDPHFLGGGWIAFPFPTYLTTNPKYDKINSVE